jgi:hypothetical protein
MNIPQNNKDKYLLFYVNSLKNKKIKILNYYIDNINLKSIKNLNKKYLKELKYIN